MTEGKDDPKYNTFPYTCHIETGKTMKN